MSKFSHGRCSQCTRPFLSVDMKSSRNRREVENHFVPRWMRWEDGFRDFENMHVRRQVVQVKGYMDGCEVSLV